MRMGLRRRHLYKDRHFLHSPVGPTVHRLLPMRPAPPRSVQGAKCADGQEGGAAAAGAAAFGTTARRVQGGFVVRGKKIFASLAGHADYYGILCTEDRGGEKLSRRDTL